MRYFKPKPGTKSAFHLLKTPFPDIAAFDAVVRSLVMTNPLGCVSFTKARKNHPPIKVVRERYTAKFEYLGPDKKQVGTGLDRYDSVEGYENGVAAVISNMANIAAHRGKVKHIPAADIFSVLLKCQDPTGEQYFLSIARDRVTISSYSDDMIRKRVETWTDSVPGLV